MNDGEQKKADALYEYLQQDNAETPPDEVQSEAMLGRQLQEMSQSLKPDAAFLYELEQQLTEQPADAIIPAENRLSVDSPYVDRRETQVNISIYMEQTRGYVQGLIAALVVIVFVGVLIFQFAGGNDNPARDVPVSPEDNSTQTPTIVPTSSPIMPTTLPPGWETGTSRPTFVPDGAIPTDFPPTVPPPFSPGTLTPDPFGGTVFPTVPPPTITSTPISIGE